MSKKVRTLLIVGICLIVILCSVLIPLAYAGVIGPTPKRQGNIEKQPSIEAPKDFFKVIPDSELKTGEYAVFNIEYAGEDYTIKMFLLRDYAPKTVENFIRYVDAGLYDNTVFYHSVMTYKDNGDAEFTYLQGGAYTLNEAGELVKKAPAPYYGKIDGEFYENDPQTNNRISFVGGTIGMVHEENDNNSADTEFFFLSYSHTQFNGKYAAFGMSLENDDIAELYRLTKAQEEAEGYPIVIKSVKIYQRKG